MVRSLPATSIQLGLVLQAAMVIVAEKLSVKFRAFRGPSIVKKFASGEMYFLLSLYG